MAEEKRVLSGLERYTTACLVVVCLGLMSVSLYHFIEILHIKEQLNVLQQQCQQNIYKIQERHKRDVATPGSSLLNQTVMSSVLIPIVDNAIHERCVNSSVMCINGPKGEKGEPGIQGFNGSRGDKGDQGPIGLQGQQGNKGEDGPMGPQGLKGDIGLPGQDGQNGSKGEQGPQGSKGDIGVNGSKGEKGEFGPIGYQGYKGDPGQTGQQGLKGEIGPVGLKGDVGAPGQQGIQGQKGEQGSVGPQGAQGVKGEVGANGLMGPPGDKGDMGVPGPQGFNGTEGPKGEKGNVGPIGTTGLQGLPGDKGSAGQKGEVGTKGDAGPQGSKGEMGVTGAAGIQGEKGVMGSPGHDGPKGLQGEKGDSGSVGPKGEQGSKGAQGPVGQKGEIGYDGPFGPMGTKGEPGVKGEKGDTGSKGEQGNVGPPGQNGLKGQEGPMGPTGSAGEKGEKGQTEVSSNCCNMLTVPQFQRGTENYSVLAKVGDTVLLPCKVGKGYPSPTVSWAKKNGNNIVDVTKGVAVNDGLIIQNIHLDDSGVYVCQASNALGSLQKTITLTITDDTPKIQAHQNMLGVAVGESVNNVCEVTNADQVTLTYSKVNGLLPTHNILPTGHLVFYFRSPDDTGEYKCDAITNKGTLSTTFTVYERLDNITCYTTFAECTQQDKAICGGDCPVGCSDLAENYHAHRFALNLPLCRAAINSGHLSTSGGHVVWKNAHASGGEAAEFLTLSNR